MEKSGMLIMKKSIILFSIVFLFSFNGNSQPGINDISKLFEETELPVGSEEITYYEDAKQLSSNEKLFFSYYKKEFVYAYYRFNLYQDYTAFIFIVKENEEGTGNLMLEIFDKEENLISQLNLDYDEANGIGFKIKPDYVIQKTIFDQGMDEMYENNGTNCAIYMKYSDPTETYSNICKINSDGNYTFFNKFIAKHTVEKYLNFLSDKNFNAAYYSQKIPKWGTLEHFSSKKAFGGITFIAVNELKYVSGNDSEAIVYCDAMYYDNTNGDSDIKQNFTVSKISGNWFITDMKIISFKRRRNYIDSNGELEHLDISLTNISDTDFDFSIEAVSYDECEQGEGNPYIYLHGTATYTDNTHAIFTKGTRSLFFCFTNENKELTLKAYRYDDVFKNSNIILNKLFNIMTL